MDRLTGLDASFLHLERDGAHMHVASTIIFDGPAPSYEEFREHLEARLHLVPRFRQRLAFVPYNQGRPIWVDDPHLNLNYHVRHTALPEPGSEEQLRNFAARAFSQGLDRSKPLWELWLVDGLEGDRFAIVGKSHHCLVDGVSGADITTVLYDTSPDPAPVDPGPPWLPRPVPNDSELLAAALIERVTQPTEVIRGVRALVRGPRQALGAVRGALEAAGSFAGRGLSAPDSPLNSPIGPHRRFAWVRAGLPAMRRIKDVHGGTVNDVILCVVAGAMRRWLRARSVRTEGLELRALVPVSIRATDQRGELGNQIAAVRGPLPVYVEDPVARLRTVREAMDGIKSSKKALGAEVISRFNDFAPPTLLAQASRINFSTRLFNLIVTNVPGPQIPLYVLGRELLDIFPVAFLPENHALAIAIMSYNGKIDFGLLGDYDAMEDILLISEGIEAEIKQLLEAAEASEKRTKQRRQKQDRRKPETTSGQATTPSA